MGGKNKFSTTFFFLQFARLSLTNPLFSTSITFPSFPPPSPSPLFHLRHQPLQLCKECFYAALEEEVHATIVEHRMFKRGERVAVCASGKRMGGSSFFFLPFLRPLLTLTLTPPSASPSSSIPFLFPSTHLQNQQGAKTPLRWRTF